jgi:hypothetical protein
MGKLIKNTFANYNSLCSRDIILILNSETKIKAAWDNHVLIRSLRSRQEKNHDFGNILIPVGQ